jgi:serine/threonine-protein kinase HipA
MHAHVLLVIVKRAQCLRALFIPRFDRQVHGGAVTRLAQESIATLTGMPGFDAVPSHDQVCLELVRQCTSPQDEVLEYLKRDVANLALGNKDNHARNTAVQRDFNGHIALTPLYDFAPMYLHPDGIARRIRWENNDAGQPDWARVLDRVCDLAEPIKKPRRKAALIVREPLVAGLKSMVSGLQRIADEGVAMGVDAGVLAHLRPGILAQAQQLAALR